MGIARGLPPFGRGVADPLEIRYTPRYPAEFGRSRSSGTSAIKEIRLKIWPLVCRLSRSVKIIETDTDRSAA